LPRANQASQACRLFRLLLQRVEDVQEGDVLLVDGRL